MSDPASDNAPVTSLFSKMLSKMSLSGSNKKYEPLRNEAVQELKDERHHLESSSEHDHDFRIPLRYKKRDTGRTVRILAALNLILALGLLAATVTLWRERNRIPAPPHSPAWEAVRYVDVRFAKDDRFYKADELDAGVDQLWLNLTGRMYSFLFSLLPGIYEWKSNTN
jgi:hypothetical protein